MKTPGGSSSSTARPNAGGFGGKGDLASILAAVKGAKGSGNFTGAEGRELAGKLGQIMAAKGQKSAQKQHNQQAQTQLFSNNQQGGGVDGRTIGGKGWRAQPASSSYHASSSSSNHHQNAHAMALAAIEAKREADLKQRQEREAREMAIANLRAFGRGFGGASSSSSSSGGQLALGDAADAHQQWSTSNATHSSMASSRHQGQNFENVSMGSGGSGGGAQQQGSGVTEMLSGLMAAAQQQQQRQAQQQMQQSMEQFTAAQQMFQEAVKSEAQKMAAQALQQSGQMSQHGQHSGQAHAHQQWGIQQQVQQQQQQQQQFHGGHQFFNRQSSSIGSAGLMQRQSSSAASDDGMPQPQKKTQLDLNDLLGHLTGSDSSSLPGGGSYSQEGLQWGGATVTTTACFVSHLETTSFC